MIKVLNEGMQAINMATATSTHDQFIALTIDPEDTVKIEAKRVREIEKCEHTSMIDFEGVQIADSNDTCHAYTRKVNLIEPYGFQRCRKVDLQETQTKHHNQAYPLPH